MADGVSGTVKISAAWVATKTVETIAGTFSDTMQLALALTAGSGDGQIDIHYFEKAKSRAASGTDTYDIASGGGLTNVFGDAIDMDKMKVLILINNSGNGANLQLGGDAAEVPYMAAVNDKINCPDGGFVAFACGLAASAIEVTATTGDIISVTETAAQAATYDLLIAGVAS